MMMRPPAANRTGVSRSQRLQMATGPRVLGSFAAGFMLLVAGSTLFSWWALGPLRLEPLMALVVSAGFRLPLLAGGLVVFVLGYLEDALSGGVIGIRVTAYLLVFFICALAQRKLEINSWPFQMVSVGLMSLVFQLGVLGGLSLVDFQHLAPANLLWVVGTQAALSAFTAPLFFGFLELMIRLAGKLLGGLGRWAS